MFGGVNLLSSSARFAAPSPAHPTSLHFAISLHSATSIAASFSSRASGIPRLIVRLLPRFPPHLVYADAIAIGRSPKVMIPPTMSIGFTWASVWTGRSFTPNESQQQASQASTMVMRSHRTPSTGQMPVSVRSTQQSVRSLVLSGFYVGISSGSALHRDYGDCAASAIAGQHCDREFTPRSIKVSGAMLRVLNASTDGPWAVGAILANAMEAGVCTSAEVEARGGFTIPYRNLPRAAPPMGDGACGPAKRVLDERRFTPPNIEARPSASGARRQSYTRGSEVGDRYRPSLKP